MEKFETVADVMASYPERFNPEAAEGTTAIIQLRLTGEDDADHYLRIQDGALSVHEGVHTSATVTATTSAQDWIALNNGEVEAMHLAMQGRAKFSGSLPMAMKFRSMFSKPD